MVKALQNKNWVNDIKVARTVQVMVDCLLIWGLVDDLSLQQNVPDQHRWKLIKSESGTYSSRSVYAAFFMGTIKFVLQRTIWKWWAPFAANFSYGWPSITDVGQLIGYPNEGYRILLLL